MYDNINVPVDSTVKIASDGILGNKYLSITPNGDSKDILKINEDKKIEGESIESGK